MLIVEKAPCFGCLFLWNNLNCLFPDRFPLPPGVVLLQKKIMIKDSIAISVFLFTVHTLASLAGLNVSSGEFLCGWLLDQKGFNSMFSFVFIYSLTGFLLSKYILNLWSGDIFKKIFLFGITFFLLDIAVALFIFKGAGIGLFIGFLEKLMFGALILVFLSIKEKESQVIVRNVKVSNQKILKCQQADRLT